MGNIISRFCTCHNEEELGAAAAAVAAAAVCVICRDEESTVNTIGEESCRQGVGRLGGLTCVGLEEG